jgi:ATP-binding cassette subfamily B protein
MTKYGIRVIILGMNIFKNNLYFLKIIYGICPGRVYATFASYILSYATWVFYSVIFIQYITRAIETERDFAPIAAFVLISAVIFGALRYLLRWWQTKYFPATDHIIRRHISMMLFDKAAGVDLSCYEDSEFYNKYTLAMQEANTRATAVLNNIADIAAGIFAGISVIGLMFSIDRFVILFIVAPFVGKFVFGKWMSDLNVARNKEQTPHKRRMGYVNRAVYLQNYAKEIRMSGIIGVLGGIYDAGYRGSLGVIRKYRDKAAWLLTVQGIFTFLIIFQGVMFYSCYHALVTKTMSLSDFTVLTSAMVSIAWMLIGLSNSTIEAMQNGLFINNFRLFLEYEPLIDENQVGIEPLTPINELALENVSYTYKGADKPSLSDINIRIGKNEKIAIVGHNGAGKSTLIKLLMRLYDPDSGQVSLNGADVRGYDLKKYRGLFGTAFQDYQIFSMTVAENILMRSPTCAEDYAVVEYALKQSGVYDKVMSYPRGMDTVLTREFDDGGAVPSGGEQQKIAVARVFANDYELMVFDEPSSALDPIAEYELFQSMMEACADKTVVFISHRLSAAVLADRVYLLEDGRVAEEGSHAELMAKNGRYADMFNKQAEKYRYDYSDE